MPTTIDTSAAMKNCFFNNLSLHYLAHNIPLPDNLFTANCGGQQSKVAKMLQEQFPNQGALKAFFEDSARSNDVKEDFFLADKVFILGALFRNLYQQKIMTDSSNCKQDMLGKLKGKHGLVASYLEWKRKPPKGTSEENFTHVYGPLFTVLKSSLDSMSKTCSPTDVEINALFESKFVEIAKGYGEPEVPVTAEEGINFTKDLKVKTEIKPLNTKAESKQNIDGRDDVPVMKIILNATEGHYYYNADAPLTHILKEYQKHIHLIREKKAMAVSKTNQAEVSRYVKNSLNLSLAAELPPNFLATDQRIKAIESVIKRYNEINPIAERILYKDVSSFDVSAIRQLLNISNKTQCHDATKLGLTESKKAIINKNLLYLKTAVNRKLLDIIKAEIDKINDQALLLKLRSEDDIETLTEAELDKAESLKPLIPFIQEHKKKIAQYTLASYTKIQPVITDATTKINSITPSTVSAEAIKDLIKLQEGNDFDAGKLGIAESATIVKAFKDQLTTVVEKKLLNIIQHKIEICTDGAVIEKLEKLTSASGTIEEADLTVLDLPIEIQDFANTKVTEIEEHAQGHATVSIIKDEVEKAMTALDTTLATPGDVMALLNIKAGRVYNLTELNFNESHPTNATEYTSFLKSHPFLFEEKVNEKLHAIIKYKISQCKNFKFISKLKTLPFSMKQDELSKVRLNLAITGADKIFNDELYDFIQKHHNTLANPITIAQGADALDTINGLPTDLASLHRPLHHLSTNLLGTFAPASLTNSPTSNPAGLGLSESVAKIIIDNPYPFQKAIDDKLLNSVVNFIAANSHDDSTHPTLFKLMFDKTFTPEKKDLDNLNLYESLVEYIKANKQNISLKLKTKSQITDLFDKEPIVRKIMAQPDKAQGTLKEDKSAIQDEFKKIHKDLSDCALKKSSGLLQFTSGKKENAMQLDKLFSAFNTGMPLAQSEKKSILENNRPFIEMYQKSLDDVEGRSVMLLDNFKNKIDALKRIPADHVSYANAQEYIGYLKQKRSQLEAELDAHNKIITKVDCLVKVFKEYDASAANKKVFVEDAYKDPASGVGTTAKIYTPKEITDDVVDNLLKGAPAASNTNTTAVLHNNTHAVAEEKAKWHEYKDDRTYYLSARTVDTNSDQTHTRSFVQKTATDGGQVQIVKHSAEVVDNYTKQPTGQFFQPSNFERKQMAIKLVKDWVKNNGAPSMTNLLHVTGSDVLLKGYMALATKEVCKKMLSFNPASIIMDDITRSRVNDSKFVKEYKKHIDMVDISADTLARNLGDHKEMDSIRTVDTKTAEAVRSLPGAT